jgi:transposase
MSETAYPKWPVFRRSWVAAFQRSLTPRTTDGVGQFSARVTGECAIAVEAMGPTWAFVDAVAPTGAAGCVVDPRKTKLTAGHAAKTDRLDARRLADALRRDSVVSMYTPPREIRALREVCRGRHQLVFRLRSPVSIEGGDAPGWQGATTENIGHI